MNAADTLPWWAALLVAALLVLGGLIALIGTLGLWRLENFYQRIHGPAITVTLGAGCILLAWMVYFSVAAPGWALQGLLITVFVLLTAPVVSMLLMRAAVSRDPALRDETDPDSSTKSGSSPMDTSGTSS